MSTDDLWDVHDQALSLALRSGAISSSRPKQNPDSPLARPTLLDVKTELAERNMRECSLCERRCLVDRTKGETGVCGVGEKSYYFFEQRLWGEEPPLVPSHEVFFSGCNMRCAYCYSWEALLDTTKGNLLVPDEFAGLVDRRRTEGAANLNLIGGEPTVHLPVILRSISRLKQPTPIVWNSNFLMSQESMRLLEGIIDLYVGDFRFGNDECAQKIADVDRYFDAASRNFKWAANSADLIVRHLLIPGHTECCLRPIAKWMADNLPEAPFNLMFQYVPFYKALEDPSLCRTLTSDEEREAEEIVSSFGLNTDRWKTYLPGRPPVAEAGSGEVSTTVIVRPDGRVAIMHLHGDLIHIARALSNGGESQ
ncbi:MAG: radical SAM protein [Armatimonadetes bacterium]|nr:radical SAM protein [Armatimonadota bacterium]